MTEPNENAHHTSLKMTLTTLLPIVSMFVATILGANDRLIETLGYGMFWLSTFVAVLLIIVAVQTSDRLSHVRFEAVGSAADLGGRTRSRAWSYQTQLFSAEDWKNYKRMRHCFRSAMYVFALAVGFGVTYAVSVTVWRI